MVVPVSEPSSEHTRQKAPTVPSSLVCSALASALSVWVFCFVFSFSFWRTGQAELLGKVTYQHYQISRNQSLLSWRTFVFCNNHRPLTA